MLALEHGHRPMSNYRTWRSRFRIRGQRQARQTGLLFVKRAFKWSGSALPQDFLRRNEMTYPDYCVVIASYAIAGDERRNSKTFSDQSACQVKHRMYLRALLRMHSLVNTGAQLQPRLCDLFSLKGALKTCLGNEGKLNSGVAAEADLLACRSCAGLPRCMLGDYCAQITTLCA